MVQPIALRLQVCTACYCAKQHEIKSTTRKNDVIKRCYKHEMLLGCCLLNTAYCFTAVLLLVERIHSKITKIDRKYINQ